MENKNFDETFNSLWIAKGLLQDYCEVIAKIENVSPETVKNRVLEKSEIIRKDWNSKLSS